MIYEYSRLELFPNSFQSVLNFKKILYLLVSIIVISFLNVSLNRVGLEVSSGDTGLVGISSDLIEAEQ